GDRDGGPDVFDRVDLRLVEQIKELAGVGAEGLDVASLAFGVKGVENERTFARAAQSGDDDVAAERQIEVESLEVVLAHAAEADAFGRGGGGARAGHGLTKRRVRKNSTAGIFLFRNMQSRPGRFDRATDRRWRRRIGDDGELGGE